MNTGAWALRHNETGKYVSVGGHHAYTNDLRLAKRYRSEEEARNDSCVESEHPVNLVREALNY